MLSKYVHRRFGVGPNGLGSESFGDSFWNASAPQAHRLPVVNNACPATVGASDYMTLYADPMAEVPEDQSQSPEQSVKSTDGQSIKGGRRRLRSSHHPAF